MKTIAFIGRKQNVRRWRFVVDGLERARIEERRALDAAPELRVVDDLSGADLVQVRLNPEQTSARALRRVLTRVRVLGAVTRVLNPPDAFALSAEKSRAYAAWRDAGLRTLEWAEWSLWTTMRSQVAQVRAFLHGRSGFLRTHNEDSGKGIVYISGADSEDERALRRVLWRLRLRALTNRVSGSRALLTAEVDNRMGDVGHVFRVHMVGGEVIGGYAVVGRGRIIHAFDATLADRDAFVAANERFAGWLVDARWQELWRRAMAAVRLDFGALEFLCVDDEPVFLEVNPMWGGRHRFEPQLTRWLIDEAPDGLRERIAHVFSWLTPFTFYERYWRAIAGLMTAAPTGATGEMVLAEGE